MEIGEIMVKEALRYIGIPKEKADEDILGKVKNAYAFLNTAVLSKAIYHCVPITKESEGILFEGTSLSIKSQNLKKLFENCDRVYLLAATLGQDLDRKLSITQKVDMLEALVLDACASVWVDRLCDDVEQKIITEIKENEFLTMRFSPGYGDVPLVCQPIILDVLNAHKRLGLTVTKTDMLVPTKSVTAFIGVSHQLEKREKSCGACNLVKSCIYKRRGEKCGL